MKALSTVRVEVLYRLSDAVGRFWTTGEVEDYLHQAYREIARAGRVFWDWRYLENLPAGFNYTAAFEADYFADLDAPFDYGQANFTADVEPLLMADLIDPRDRVGPARHTSPFEATDLHLSAIGASAIPALAALPATVTAIDRPVWDSRAIRTITERDAMAQDNRFETTQGEVYALLPKMDGLNTVRKIRVPAAQADTVTVTGGWGLLRDPADLTGAPVLGQTLGAFEPTAFEPTAFYTNETAGVWGIPRRLPGHHTLGSERWGLPRRPYLDGKNVRVEVFREGRAVDEAPDVFELPDHMTVYARDYAISRCLAREGPAQDSRLAKHYDDRYRRGIARVQRRVQAQQRRRVAQLGGARPGLRRPPRPSLPWNYGREVR